MKRTVLPLLAILFVALLAFAANEPQGTLDFKGAQVEQVLPIYKAMSGCELFVDSRVKTVPASINLRSSQPLVKAVAIKRIEKALLEQARVVITRLDDKRASVTYNDALPVVSPSESSEQ
jgi:hypothetical protein